MSSILKALKKLEEEKTVRRDRPVDVARGILRVTPEARKSGWVLPVSVTGAAVAAALLTFVAVGGRTSPDGETVPVSSPQVTADSATTRHRAPEPVLSSKSGPGEDKIVIDVAPESAGKMKRVLPSAPVLAYPRPSQRPPAAAKKSSSSAEVLAPERADRELPVNVEVPPQPLSDRPLPMLKVSGIAWQKGSSDRFAVVNGMSVTEGTTVDGARVEEIFLDKVRFSFQKKIFDVAVGKEMQ